MAAPLSRPTLVSAYGVASNSAGASPRPRKLHDGRVAGERDKGFWRRLLRG